RRRRPHRDRARGAARRAAPRRSSRSGSRRAPRARARCAASPPRLAARPPRARAVARPWSAGDAPRRVAKHPGSSVTPQSSRRRLCLKDLYQQDIVEMIERETRRYELQSIEDPSDPDFERAYRVLWQGFGPAGEMETEGTIRGYLERDPYEPIPSGTFIRYFLIAARDRDGNLRGVRDGSVLYNAAYAPDLCLVYLSHIFMLPEARGTVLTYWLRVAPIELAVEYLFELQRRGLASLPAPDQPGRYFGLHLDLVAEMEYFSPEDLQSLQRILFYGRGGFDAIDPRHF